MADAMLRRKLETAFDPGAAFPSASLLSRTMARLDAEPKSGYHRSGPMAVVAAVAFLVLFALGLLQLHTWFLGSHRIMPARQSPHPTFSQSPQLTSGSHGVGWAFGGLAMVNPTTGWDNGVPFMHTTDGVHWTNVTPLGVGRSFDDYYLDATHAWVTDYSGVEPTQIVTFRTADGGQTWERGEPIQIQAALGQTQQYYVDPVHGWLLLSSANHANASTIFSDSLYRTEDGGLHWRLSAVNSAPANWRPAKFYCYQWCRMAFVSASKGWIIGSQNEPTFVITQDGGATWHPWDALFRSATRPCPCLAELPTFFDQDHGWILLRSQAPASRAEALLVTSNGGSNWTPRPLPGAPMVVGFYDADHGWAWGESSAALQVPLSATPPTLALSLYRTRDGGLTWTQVVTTLKLQSKDGQLNGLYFLDDATGFAFRTPVGGQLWELLRTTDGGRIWMVIGRNL